MEREVPLYELLEAVPEKARLVIDSENELSTQYIPVGTLCQQAAKELRQALAQPEQEPGETPLSWEEVLVWLRIKDEQ